jgi:uncharacterized protein (TIGR02001 family)
MKRMTQLAAGLALVSSALVASTAAAEVSYNIGWASEYYYRGILQKESSGSAGIDYEESGFYVGAWTADVGDGLEIDGYFGYGIETDSGFTASVGFTGYYYTGEFDDTYEEVNFNFGYGIASLEYSVGEWDGFGSEADYDFLALTLDFGAGFYGTFGTFGDEFDGEYFEVGYGTTIADIDFGVAAIFSGEELSDQCDISCDLSGARSESSEALVFTIGKTF